MSRNDCVFCRTADLKIIAENDVAYAIRDKFPARPLHSLIIPKRHVAHIFQTNAEEREAIHALAALCCEAIQVEDPEVAGFNFGSNVGEAAGQKVYHAHVHLVPRRFGDDVLPPARPDNQR